MKTALFTNFTSEPFEGWWDGKRKVFAPGQSLYMPDYLARHFAKHLTNQELLKKGLERSTSPKKPEDVPEFMELFNKAYTPDEEEDMGNQNDGIDALIGAANKNREKGLKTPRTEESSAPGQNTEPKKAEKQNPNEPQMVPVPEDDEDGEDAENQPVE